MAWVGLVGVNKDEIVWVSYGLSSLDLRWMGPSSS